MAKKPEKPMSKTEILNALAESSELNKKDVAKVLDSLEGLIVQSITKGAGKFQLLGLMKVEVKVRPATKEKPGRNPLTGATIMIAAKPARKVVKVRALKKLKDLVPAK